jgi:phosphoribosylamine--glycine ligase
LPIFGPHKKAALLETSKIYAKKFMTKYHIPTATYKVFTNFTQTKTYLIKAHYPLVIKADGLAAGKGVVIVNNFNQANKCIEAFMQTDIFHNQAGKKVVIESYLTGYEASIICLVDHHQILPMVSAKDHKQAYDHDLGPNTGGMGVIAPNPYLTKKDLALFHQKILLPTLKGLKQEKINYQGFIFFGVMLTPDGPKLLEYNTRMGDPETQAILPLMESDFYEVIN